MRAQISITGTGAVSPAGWGVAALMTALTSGEKIATSMLERSVGETTFQTPVLRVPAEGATTPKFARLRRTSPISKFAAAAVAEALGDARLAEITAGRLRVGVIFTLTNGCVNYSNRFFGEALADPAFASPILFPETVFNAPSSHLSALIGNTMPPEVPQLALLLEIHGELLALPAQDVIGLSTVEAIPKSSGLLSEPFDAANLSARHINPSALLDAVRARLTTA